MEEVRENKMGTQPIGDLLFKMSLPIMISMLVQALYNIVDSIFVAKISEDALTAVSLAFPVQNLMIALGAGTGVGINALLSKSLGEKNFKLANSAANNGIFLCLVNFAIFHRDLLSLTNLKQNNHRIWRPVPNRYQPAKYRSFLSDDHGKTLAGNR